MKNPITKEQRLNLLTSAIEGGSNYWYLFDEGACKIIYGLTEDQTTPEGIPFVDKVFEALEKGASIPISDIETEEILGELSMKSIKEGESLMLEKSPSHFADIISNNDDSITADVWFQYAVMKDIIYG